MKAGKVTIEIPAGKTKEEIHEIFREVVTMIQHDMFFHGNDGINDLQRDYYWPQASGASFTDMETGD